MSSVAKPSAVLVVMRMQKCTVSRARPVFDILRQTAYRQDGAAPLPVGQSKNCASVEKSHQRRVPLSHDATQQKHTSEYVDLATGQLGAAEQSSVRRRSSRQRSAS